MSQSESDEIQRIAIVLTNTLPQAICVNTAAILMGQAALCTPGLFATNPLRDNNGVNYAAIKFSTVILRSTQTRLVRLLREAAMNDQIYAASFPKIGHQLHNDFHSYARIITSSDTSELEPVGAIVIGADSEIRKMTKSFTLYK
jgi:hypothetical protein